MRTVTPTGARQVLNMVATYCMTCTASRTHEFRANLIAALGPQGAKRHRELKVPVTLRDDND
jgi:hypothetical protein